jgi:uncharacterized protein (DUF1501 family)
VFSAAAALSAQTATGYKSLVCVFLFGGNDSGNTVVPLDTQDYRTYSNGRRAIALEQNVLVPIQAQGRAYGLHPRLAPLRELYQQRRMAIAANVGMLVRPVTREEVTSGRGLVPRNLYSHSDQVQQWQSGNASGGGAAGGWLGRATDLLVTPDATAFPPAVSLAGNSLLLTGTRTAPANLGGSGVFGLDTIGEDAPSTARLSALEQILAMESGMTLVNAFGGTLSAGLRNARELRRMFAGAPPLKTTFPQSSLGNQLRQTAEMIALRGRLGVRRQTFFCSTGGYDNHSSLLSSHDNRLAELGPALAAFYRATEELGVADSVTLFTESEFGRTFGPSATAGSDHGWGSHQLILGGAVKGGDAYGRFPDLTLRGPDDAGDRGVWIPSTSLDQYAATLAAWFGVGASEMPSILPNIGQFQDRTMGFAV